MKLDATVSRRLRKIDKPAVFLFNGIGDHVLAMPTLRALARAFDGRLTVACAEGAPRFLFAELPLRGVVVVGRPTAGSAAIKAPPALRYCDLAILLSPWIRSPLARLLESLDSAVSVGPNIFCDLKVQSRGRPHAADVGFWVARAIIGDLDMADFSEPLKLSVQSRKKALEVRRSMRGARRMLVLHAETQMRKQWRYTRLREVVRGFLRTHPDYCVRVVGQGSVAPDRWAGEPRVAECGGLSLEESFALVSQADLFLGMDSCMLHVADISRVPSVGLFGPTHAWRWGFRFSPGVAVQGRGGMGYIRVIDVGPVLHEMAVRTLMTSR